MILVHKLLLGMTHLQSAKRGFNIESIGLNSHPVLGQPRYKNDSHTRIVRPNSWAGLAHLPAFCEAPAKMLPRIVSDITTPGHT